MANLRDLIAATGLVILLKMDSIVDFLEPGNLRDDLKKLQGTSSALLQALCIISKPSVNYKCSYNPETLNSVQNRRFFLSRVTLTFYGRP